MKYENKSFKMVAKDVVFNYTLKSFDFRTFGFNFIAVNFNPRFYGYVYGGIVSQKFDQIYNRTVQYYTLFFSTNDIQTYAINKTEFRDYEKLENVSTSYEMIAILATNRFGTYVLFRFNSSIKYCTLDEVNTHFNQMFV